MNQIRVKLGVGVHYENGVAYKPGQTFTTHGRPDKSFENKLEFVGVKKNKPVEPKKPEGDQVPSKGDEAPEEGDDKGELEDADFDFSPEDTGLHVYRRGSRYYVYDADDMEEALNEKGLTKKKVIPFINSQCEE